MSDSEARPVISVQDVVRSFGRRRVLKGVSFSMRRGETVAITGENGAGKSTLLNILVGRLRADSGNVVRHARVGYCPQETLVFEDLTVTENFRYFAAAYGIAWSRTEPRVEELLRRFRFESYRRTLVSQLSGGTRQKLNLTIAFLNSPELLILDEPYSGFDWETYLHFWEYAAELRRAGSSFLLVAHFVQDPTRFDKMYALKEGMLETA